MSLETHTRETAPEALPHRGRPVLVYILLLFIAGGGGLLRFAAGGEGKRHNDGKHQSEKLFHSFDSFLISNQLTLCVSYSHRGLSQRLNLPPMPIFIAFSYIW